MKNLTLVVPAFIKEPLADALREYPEVTGFVFTPVEGHGTHTSHDEQLSERDRVAGYVPRVRVDLVLDAVAADSGLFGEGSAAVLMVGESHPLAQPGLPRVIDSQSQFFPETEHIMGWEVTNSGFKVMLSSDIANLAQSEGRPGMEAFLGRHNLSIAEIDHWLVHPGGPRVIQALVDGLGCPMKPRP